MKFNTLMDRWWGKLSLLLTTTVLMSLSFAPAGQFYLAWIGLIPWLLVVRRSRTHRAAFLWSWLGGTLFFIANMWWLYKVTLPGMFALLIYLGAFFGYAALILRACRLIDHQTRDASFRASRFHPAVSMLMIATVWIALEYIRGNWSMFGNQGLPWLNLGTTQTPFLLMCQVADFGSGYAVSFWVVVVNVAIFQLFSGTACGAFSSERFDANNAPQAVPLNKFGGIATAAIFVAATVAYGAWRLSQTQPLHPGPRVLVVQPNYRQSNNGEKGAPPEDILAFHLTTTRAALAACEARGEKVELVAWSETMMPPLNDSARELIASSRNAMQALGDLTFNERIPLLAGGLVFDDWHERGDELVPAQKRNSAFYFQSSGVLSDQRYDKIHLVPFGEFIPFSSINWIHSILLKLGPSGYEDYVLTPGNETDPTIFRIESEAGTFRVATPICFEDLVSDLVAKIVRGNEGGKRVDVLVNLTNDGWFLANEMPQHLQASIFRSIENRVPTARSVNTGVSGFIDSTGHVHDTVAAGTAGWAEAQMTLDSRVTFYTRFGDVIPIVSVVGVVILIGYSVAARRKELA